MVTPALFRMVGRAPLGRVPWASVSMTASWAGSGLGNPSGSGNLKGVAATLAAKMERDRNVVEVKCMVRMGGSQLDVIY